MYLKGYILIFAILSACCFEWIASYTWNKPVCDFQTYYEPYITVQLTRTSPPTLSETTKTFVDLRTHSGILCINGPAFLYKTLEARTITGGNGISIFSPNPDEIDVYYNQCMTFNRRNIGFENQSSAITETTDVIGLKVYGIALVGEPQDYREPHHRLFHHKQFGYALNGDEEYPKILGASFAFVSVPNDKLQTGLVPILDPPCPQPEVPACVPPHRVVEGPKALCIHIAGNNTVLVFVPKPIIGNDDGDTGYVCTLQPDADVSEYFPPDNLKELYTWMTCPDGFGDSVEEVTEITIDSMEDFRIIDPKHKTPKGTLGKYPKPGYPNYNIKTIASGKSPTYEKFPFPGYYFQNENGVQAGGAPSENISINYITKDVKDCKAITPPENCNSEDNGEEACELLNHVLTIEHDHGDQTFAWHRKITEENNEFTFPAAVTPDQIDDINKGSWRKKLLNYIEDIYIKACPQVPASLAPAITRVIEYYLFKVITDPTANNKDMDEWKQETIENDTMWYLYYDELQNCQESKMQLKFNRIKNNEAQTSIEALQNSLANQNLTEAEFVKVRKTLTTDRSLRLPFKTVVAKLNNKKYTTPLYYEAAQVDYNLNWAIDTFWKMLVTVLGYCNKVYFETKGLSIAFHTEVNYDKDIFEFLKPKWSNEDETDGSNAIFDQLFGQFIHEVPSEYIDMCMEGSYVAADLEKVERPIRNIPLRLEDDAPLDSNKSSNFFVYKQISTEYGNVVNRNADEEDEDDDDLRKSKSRRKFNALKPMTDPLNLPNTDPPPPTLPTEDYSLVVDNYNESNFQLPNTHSDSSEKISDVSKPEISSLSPPNTDYDSIEFQPAKSSDSLQLPNTENDS